MEVTNEKHKTKTTEKYFGNWYPVCILLSGCSKENVPKEEALMDSGIESTVAEKDSMPEEKKASYPADNPEDITLWMDNSGGAMTDFMLFKECGPG